MRCTAAVFPVIAASVLLTMPACNARLPENKYRCDTHADCRPELPYCLPVGPDRLRVCTSESGMASDVDASERARPDDAGPETDGDARDGDAADPGTVGQAGASEAGASGMFAAGSGGAGGRPSSSSGGAGSSGAAGEPPPPPTSMTSEDPRLRIHEDPAAYIKADSAQAQRHFGASVAVRGQLLVVGAPQDDVAETGVRYRSQAPAAPPADRTDVGAAYVYRFGDGRWELEACLAVPNGKEAHFAQSVAIDDEGRRIAVGVAQHGGSNQRVYLYARDAQMRWVPHWPQGLVNPPDAAGFGAAVALHGDTLVVGAPDVLPMAPADDVPEVFVYTLDADGLVQQPPVRLTVPGDIKSRFGDSVAVWGDAIVVGARFADGSRSDMGAAYLFRRDPETRQWSPEATPLLAPEPDVNDNMGKAVAIDDDYVAVGAPGAQPWIDGEPDLTREDEGAVHLFHVQTGEYAGTVRPAEGGTLQGRMGESVALEGDRLIAGAPGGYVTHPSAGRAYVFRHGAWDEPSALLQPRAEDVDPHDRFGAAVGLTREFAVIGSPFEDSMATGVGGDRSDDASKDNGAVYFFAL